MTLTFSILLAIVMTFSHVKIQGLRSVGSKDRVETNGRTDREDCITSITNNLEKNNV